MDKYVVKTGKIFQAGDYPDKNFKLEAIDLSKIVERFKTPVPIDLNHKSSGLKRLDAKLGKLTKIWQEDNGQLFGQTEIPIWLHEEVCKDDDGKDLPLPVSCAFGPNDEGQLVIKKLALTDTPRVSDAAIFAAFSKAHPEEVEEILAGEPEITGKNSSKIIKELVEFAKKNAQTHEGQSVLQQVHDILAKSGAVCNPDTELHSAAELSAIQTAHDEIVAAGAICRALKEGERPCTWFSSELSGTSDVNIKGDNMDSERLSLVQNILKFINGDTAAAPTPEGGRLATGFSGGTLGTAVAIEPVEKEESTELSSKVEELQRSLEAEQEKTKRLIADGIAAQSKILANEIIAGKHAQEKDRGTLEAAFAQALKDDQDNPAEIQFSADKKGGRVETLKTLYSVRTLVPLTEETVDETATEVLLSTEGQQGQDDEKKKRLEAVAERGRKLAERKNKMLRK